MLNLLVTNLKPKEIYARVMLLDSLICEIITK